MTGHSRPNNCVDGFCAANFTSPYGHSSSELGSENISIHNVWTAYGDKMRKRERDLMLMLLTVSWLGSNQPFLAISLYILLSILVVAFLRILMAYVVYARS